jgi:BolA protein
MQVRASILRKLTDGLQPVTIEVIDESGQHQGHGGWREGGETHFRVRLVSESFRGKTRVERHRIVNGLLADELAGRVHALAITAKAPGE